MIFGDFGTSWTKILDTGKNERYVTPTRRTRGMQVDMATGHNAALHSDKTAGELLVMARGGEKLIGGDFNLLDVGSRDMKFISVEKGKPVKMDWNSQCGAMTGFTLDLLGNYYGLDFTGIEPADREYPMTCGVLGLEKAFDDMAKGIEPEEALARFAKGLAHSAYRFAGKPDRVHLSGGMCDNPLFLKSFPDGVEIIPAGRYVLVEGLAMEMRQGV